MSTVVEPQERNIAYNGKDNVSVVVQPTTTRCRLRVYKIVVLGDGGVGKSGIVDQIGVSGYPRTRAVTLSTRV